MLGTVPKLVNTDGSPCPPVDSWRVGTQARARLWQRRVAAQHLKRCALVAIWKSSSMRACSVRRVV